MNIVKFLWTIILKTLEKAKQLPGRDHPCYAWTKKSLAILRTLICSTDISLVWWEIVFLELQALNAYYK